MQLDLNENIVKFLLEHFVSRVQWYRMDFPILFSHLGESDMRNGRGWKNEAASIVLLVSLSPISGSPIPLILTRVWPRTDITFVRLRMLL